MANGRFLIGGLAMAAGVALALAAWPRFVGGVAIAPYGDLLRAIARGANPPAEEVKAAREASAVSLTWYANAATMNRRGAFELVEARDAKTPQLQQSALKESVRWLRAGLARAPGQGFAWLQLAQGLRALEGATADLNGPLRMSLRTAPYEHRLIIPRLDVAFRSWPVLAMDVRKSLTPQIRRAVDTAPKSLVRLTRRTFALRQVRAAVADSPVHRDRFNIVYLAAD